MIKICAGDTGSFNELYERYSKRILYYFYRMLGNSEEKAQDFLQDIFMKIIEKPELFNPKKKFSTWVFCVAHNMCKNEYRSNGVRKIVENHEDLSAFCINSKEEKEQMIDLKSFTEKLYKELDKMDENHKTTFLLRNREGFSIKEIGKALNCSEGTVKSRLFYTCKKLASKLAIYQPLLRN